MKQNGAHMRIESIRSSIPPCPGKMEPMSFTPRSRLRRDSDRSPMVEHRTATTATSRARYHGSPRPSVTMSNGDRRHHGARESLPRLLGRDARAHRVLAPHDSEGPAPGVVGHRHHDEQRDHPRGLIHPGQRHCETAQERDPGQRENGCHGVARGSFEPVEHPPDEDGAGGEEEGYEPTGETAHPGGNHHGERPDPQRHQGNPDIAGKKGARRLPQAHAQGHRHETHEDLHAEGHGGGHQRQKQQRCRHGGLQVASRLGGGGRRRLGRVRGEAVEQRPSLIVDGHRP